MTQKCFSRRKHKEEKREKIVKAKATKATSETMTEIINAVDNRENDSDNSVSERLTLISSSSSLLSPSPHQDILKNKSPLSLCQVIVKF